MASLFGDLFGGPKTSKGLFSVSNAFRRRVDELGDVQGGDAGGELLRTATTEGGAGGRGGGEENELPKKKKRQDAGQNKKRKSEQEQYDTSKSAAKTRSLEQADEQVVGRKKQGAARAPEAEKDAVAATHVSSRAAKKAKKGSEKAASSGEDGPDLLHKEEQPDAGVVRLADKGKAEREHGASKVQAERRAGKRQRPSQSGATLLASQAEDVLKSDPEEARRVVAANGSQLGHEEALERLALLQRAEQVRNKRGRDQGEQVPAKHAGEQEEAPDAQVRHNRACPTLCSID